MTKGGPDRGRDRPSWRTAGPVGSDAAVGDGAGPDGALGRVDARVAGVVHLAVAGVDAHVPRRGAEEDEVAGAGRGDAGRGPTLLLGRARQALAVAGEDVLGEARAVEAGRRRASVDVGESGELRSDGTAIYSLMRNIGSSIGISVVQTFITRNTQVAHASLVAHVSVYDPVVQSQVDLHSPGAIALLDMQITQQAAMIAYIDDFKLMFIATLLVIPLLAIIRPARRSRASPADAHVAMD